MAMVACSVEVARLVAMLACSWKVARLGAIVACIWKVARLVATLNWPPRMDWPVELTYVMQCSSG